MKNTHIIVTINALLIFPPHSFYMEFVGSANSPGPEPKSASSAEPPYPLTCPLSLHPHWYRLRPRRLVDLTQRRGPILARRFVDSVLRTRRVPSRGNFYRRRGCYMRRRSRSRIAIWPRWT